MWLVAPSFCDIFCNNARKNGLLLIRLLDHVCERLRSVITLAQFARMTVDLDQQRITLASGGAIGFDVDPDDRRMLMDGLDDVDRTIRHEAAMALVAACAGLIK